ncbi:RluA family pseudouridine synthase [Ferruginibacter lapsinanis]|uniref:RluA family pseudouridine synthase n=1 Tax=Ferruginibacter lapsinanis TaxID=563172 RepID=UPI001E3DB1E8|nr:RluA family pseudouridine synthase [Ferruginibacter lapsinanis]UEG49131.1 RluA family pseudouridine synthase [Ferruginibacter lapsinanis]
MKTEEEIEIQDSEELYEKLVLEIDKGQEPLRIDKFLMTRIEGATRNKIQQAIDNEMVLVNDKPIKSNYKVKPADKIVVFDNKNPETTDIVPENIPLNIVFEDDDIMIINKPAGMVVHPGSGNYSGTLVNGIAYYLQKQNEELTEIPLSRLGLVHRIDKNTTGLLVIAKNQHAMSHLAKQFFNHTVHRRYVALAWGNFDEDNGTITGHVGRHQRFRKLFTTYPDGEYGKDAITHYKVLERFNYVTLIECRLETGRTHQIRVHMQYIGHPLFNDDFYGGDRIVKGTVFARYKQFVDNCFALCNRQALHAKELGFIHPTTGKPVHFVSEIPEDMNAVIEKWRKYSTNKNDTE